MPAIVKPASMSWTEVFKRTWKEADEGDVFGRSGSASTLVQKTLTEVDQAHATSKLSIGLIFLCGLLRRECPRLWTL
jgi:predicted flavoprotein YhiN